MGFIVSVVIVILWVVVLFGIWFILCYFDKIGEWCNVVVLILLVVGIGIGLFGLFFLVMAIVVLCVVVIGFIVV